MSLSKYPLVGLGASAVLIGGLLYLAWDKEIVKITPKDYPLDKLIEIIDDQFILFARIVC